MVILASLSLDDIFGICMYARENAIASILLSPLVVWVYKLWVG